MHRGLPHRYLIQDNATIDQQIALAKYVREHPEQTDAEFDAEMRRLGARPLSETFIRSQ